MEILSQNREIDNLLENKEAPCVFFPMTRLRLDLNALNFLLEVYELRHDLVRLIRYR